MLGKKCRKQVKLFWKTKKKMYKNIENKFKKKKENA